MSIIEVHDLWKRFRLRPDRASSFAKMFSAFSHRSHAEAKDFWALKAVSFSLGYGNSMGVIGVNGSGKSTLLKLLAGTLRPTKGLISARGKRCPLIELGAGFHPDFSGRDNIYLNGMILGMSRAQVKSKFDEIVAFAELEQFIDVPVKYYSSGMQARLGFAVAIAVEPDVLMVDEVLAVGDGSFQQKCLNQIRKMQHDGMSLLLVSHALPDIETVCHEAIWLHKGEVVLSGNAQEVVAEYRAEQENQRNRRSCEEISPSCLGDLSSFAGARVPGVVAVKPDNRYANVVMSGNSLVPRVDTPSGHKRLDQVVGNVVDLGNGWRWVDWFGYFTVSTCPWVYHHEHQWLCSLGSSTDNLLFWDPRMNALWWTSEMEYPYSYRFSDGAWLFYEMGSVNPRWFYNFSTAKWESN